MEAIKKLLAAQKRNNSLLCVGLDTEFSKLPEHLKRHNKPILKFNQQLVEATQDLVCAYKINFAFYEQYGSEGIDVLKTTIDFLPEDILIIADAKRGDIGNTSKAYAKCFFDYFQIDAVTVNPYMGFDSVEPYLEYEDKFIFLLTLTSNQGSNDFQKLISDGKPVYRHVIEKSLHWGDNDKIGYVVGATHPGELSELRDVAPGHLFLIPGIGAQGGDIKSVFDANSGGNAIVNVSRAIIYASTGTDYADVARKKAQFYVEEFNKYK